MSICLDMKMNFLHLTFIPNTSYGLHNFITLLQLGVVLTSTQKNQTLFIPHKI
jgi:hypothetical protein